MSCQLKFAKNESINGVTDPNTGKESTLFRQIVSNPHLTVEKAVEAYKNVFAPKIRKKFYSIVGEKGAERVEKLAKSLERAKKLDGQDKSMTAIEKETGWYKFQGDWRMIDEEIVKQFKIKNNTVNKRLTLKEVLGDENRLFEIYPSMGEIEVVFVEEGREDTPKNTPESITNNYGVVSKDKNTIYINSLFQGHRVPLQQQEYTLAHEVAHIQQLLEGLPRGGHPVSLIDEALFIMGKSRKELAKEGVPLHRLITLVNNFNKEGLTENQSRILEDSKKTVQNLYNKDKNGLIRQYFHFVGEIDARVAEYSLEFRGGKKLNTSYSNLLYLVSRNYNIDLDNVYLLGEGEVQFRVPEGEPKLQYRTPDGEVYDTYQEALKNTDQGQIQGIVMGEVFFSVDSTTSSQTLGGVINSLIKQDVLTGESILDVDGQKILLTEGNGNKKFITQIQATDMFNKTAGKGSYKALDSGDVIITAESLDEIILKDNEGNEVRHSLSKLRENSFEENEKILDRPSALSIEVAKIRTEKSRARASEDVKVEELETVPENVLQQKLVELLNNMGVKITSITEYIEKYAQKNGVEPSAQALADIANQIVAFKNGEITTEELSEETAHFIVETWDQTEIENLMRNVHRTQEYAEHAENYRRIYSQENPRASKEQIEQYVRKEILGKVLANSLQNQFSTEGKEGLQAGIIGQIQNFFTRLFDKINSLWKPRYQQQLDEFNQQIYQNLLNNKLSDQLTPLQDRKGTFNIYYNAKNKNAVDLLASEAYKLADTLKNQASALRYSTDRAEVQKSIDKVKKAERELKEKEITKEAHQLQVVAAFAELTSIAKRNVKFLESIQKKKANNKDYVFSSEEQVVYNHVKGVTLATLQKAQAVMEDPSFRATKEVKEKAQKLQPEINGTIGDINSILGRMEVGQEDFWEAQVDRIVKKHSLTENDRETLLKAVEGTQKDTNWFFAHVSSMVHAHDPLLNMAAEMISGMGVRKNIRTIQAQKNLLNEFEKLGVKDPHKLLKTLQDGGYILTNFDYAAQEQDLLEFKVKEYKRLEGEDITTEVLREREEDNALNFTDENENEYSKSVKDYINKEYRVDALKEKERAKREVFYEAKATVGEEGKKEIFSLHKEAIDLDKSWSRERGQIAREASLLDGYSHSQTYRMNELNQKKHRAKNPFTEQGELLPGLKLTEDNKIEWDGVTPLDDLENTSSRVLSLHLIDQRRQDFFEKEGKEKGITTYSEFKKRIDELSDDPTKQLEFYLANANISFSQEFWDSLRGSEGVVQKLRNSDKEGAQELADSIQKVSQRRNFIMRANRVWNRPSETNYKDMGGSDMATILELTERLQDSYRQASAILNEKDSKSPDPIFDSTTNDAWRQEIENRGITTAKETIDFIVDKKHTTSTDRRQLEVMLRTAKRLVENGNTNGLQGRSANVFTTEYSDNKTEREEQVYGDLQRWAESRLLPYFRKIEPKVAEGESFSDKFAKLQTQEITVDEFRQYIEGNPQYFKETPSYIWADSTNENLSEEYKSRERLGMDQIKIYGSKDKDGKRKMWLNKRFYDFFGIPLPTEKDLQDPNYNEEVLVTKNLTEYKALKALMRYHEGTLEATNMTGYHNKYLLPQQGMRGARQFKRLFSNDTLGAAKEIFKDMFSFRADEQEYGETVRGQAAANKNGDLRIPKYGFRRLKNQDDLSDELLTSYMWMRSEAETYKARTEVFGDIERIKNLILNQDYGDKAAEATNTYKMFDSAIRYNIYGQNETFSYETDLFGMLPGKINLAPIARLVQWWVRLTNLGFGVIVPMTSLSQGLVNTTIEKFVGERLDKDASIMGRKLVPKLLSGATGEAFEFNSKSRLNSLGEFLGQYDIQDRFKNSSFNKMSRGVLKMDFLTHTMADAPLKAQAIASVLSDYRVIGEDILNYQSFRRNQKAHNEGITEKDIREKWRGAETNIVYNYLIDTGIVNEKGESERSGIIEWDVDRVTKAMFGEDVNLEEKRGEIRELLDIKQQAISESVKILAQEIDTMIPAEQRSIAQRNAIFSFTMLHRGWMTVAYNRKLKSRHLNLLTGIQEEGNWTGIGSMVKKIIQDSKSGEKKGQWLNNVKNAWEGASDIEKRTLRRTAAEFATANAMVVVAMLLMGMADDDDDDSWIMQFSAYMAYRTANEQLSMTSPYGYPRQLWEFMEAPTVGISNMEGVADIFDVFSGRLIEHGKYRGETERSRWVYKNLPLAKESFKVANAKKTRQTYSHYNAPMFKYTAATWFFSQDEK